MCFALIVQDSIELFETCWNLVGDFPFRSKPSNLTKKDKNRDLLRTLKRRGPYPYPKMMALKDLFDRFATLVANDIWSGFALNKEQLQVKIETRVE